MRSSRAGLKTEAGEASTVPPGHGKPAQPGQLPGAAEEPTGPFKTTGEVDDATGPSDSECVICLGELSIVGKLECCSHTFCFDCIMEWSKTENRCPMCRKRFTTLTKVDLNEQSKSQSSSKSKTRRRPPAKIKIQTRDQNQSMRYGHDEAGGAHHFLLDPFFTDFFDPIFLNAGQPAWLERRRGRHDRISELLPEHRVGHVPPVDLFMPDFHLLMAAEEEEDDDDDYEQPGRRYAMHHPHTAGVGHLPPREPRIHDGRPSASGPGRRQVEHVIEFSQRIRYSTGGHPPSSRGGGSSTAQAPASSRGASSSAALAAAAGASSSSSSAAPSRAGRSSSSRGAGSGAAMVAGTIFDPVVLDDDDDEDDEEPEVSIVGTRRPAVPAQQPPRAPALRGAAVSFHDFPPFLLGGPLLDPAAIMMRDPDQHWIDFFQGPAPRARALGRPEPMPAGPAAPGPASSSSSSRRRLGASSTVGPEQDWVDFFRDPAARARALGLPEPMQPAAPGPASSSSSAAHARGQPSSSSSSSSSLSRRRPASEALAVEQSLLGEEASEEAHGEAGGRQKRRRRR